MGSPAVIAALYSAVKLRRVGRGAGSPDRGALAAAYLHGVNAEARDPFCSGGCLLLLTYASPVTPYEPTPIAGVSHTSLTERGLPRCEPNDQTPAVPLGQQMQLGGQSSPRATHPPCRPGWSRLPLQ